jgi:hypothetical protein
MANQVNAFGTLNLGNGVKYQTPQLTTDQLLQQIADDIKALRVEYVPSPKLWKMYKFTLAAGVTGIPLLCDGNNVNRIYIQCFTATGLVSIFFNSSITPNQTPDLQIGANPFPTVIPYPEIPTDVTVRNDSAVLINGTLIISSASG